MGAEHPVLVWLLSGIGSVHVSTGKYHNALMPLERAIGVCTKKSCQPEPHARSLFALAQALVFTGKNLQRATKLAKRAQAVLSKTPTGFKRELAEVDAWLKQHNKDWLNARLGDETK